MIEITELAPKIFFPLPLKVISRNLPLAKHCIFHFFTMEAQLWDKFPQLVLHVTFQPVSLFMGASLSFSVAISEVRCWSRRHSREGTLGTNLAWLCPWFLRGSFQIFGISFVENIILVSYMVCATEMTQGGEIGHANNSNCMISELGFWATQDWSNFQEEKERWGED